MEIPSGTQNSIMPASRTNKNIMAKCQNNIVTNLPWFGGSENRVFSNLAPALKYKYSQKGHPRIILKHLFFRPILHIPLTYSAYYHLQMSCYSRVFFVS